MEGDAVVPPPGARVAPAAARNRDPILAVLRRVLPETGVVLEVASGTGEHAIHMARALPGLVWRPSDPDPDARISIAAWRAEAGLSNLDEPMALDAASPTWPVTRADAVVSINMIHIAPWEAGLGLLAGAGRLLPPGGPLVLYGPFNVDGRFTAPSNAEFDASLKARDPRWGIRDVADVAAAAQAEGLVLAERIDMPANNMILVLRRTR
ncbi:DUF938 domain-containing protein [Salinarimonas ramus]|uniref:SAM-dependent methyltransferase n=1 Tax=Salinarimonas ramus TaxID=690164 RepID=A0A917Q6X7_9HYPH|nr:DUF938 domain-containing protein [Salinarimonas ramus]GGK32324.1 SAM-dependent methyltransferase [Salinarimonas ramus]